MAVAMASASRTLLHISFLLLALAAAASEAREFLVGGTAGGWKALSTPSYALNKWAEANRFHVGDSLVFEFGAGDSVLEVTREDYNRCSTASPVAAYKTSAATVRLARSGAYYFLSGIPGSCNKGERLVVVVMSERHGRRHVLAPAPTAAAATAPGREGPAAAPAPAPASGAVGRVAGGCPALLLGAVLGAAVLGF